MFLATAESELSCLAKANKNKIKPLSLSLSTNVEVRRAETRVLFFGGGGQALPTSYRGSGSAVGSARGVGGGAQAEIENVAFYR